MSIENGVLYIVSTPIGNLGDLSPRALETLKQVDRIACEDTRHSGRLLRHFGIDRPLTALHEHNEQQAARGLIERMRQGEKVAQISDAGTPLVSDPGYHLVRMAQEAAIAVVPIPGPTAAMVALSVSGLPTDRFVFEGFLPARAGPRRERLQGLLSEPRTLIFYEAPHRVADTLDAMVEVFGPEREAVLARELTKLHETVRRLSLGDMRDWVHADPDQQRGECVLLLAGAPPRSGDELSSEECRIAETLAGAVGVKEAAALTAELTGRRRNLVYRYLLDQRGS